MKSIIKHFIPNQFKKQKELIFKKNSFNKVMTGYVILLMFLLIILFTIGGEANYKKNQVFMYSHWKFVGRKRNIVWMQQLNLLTAWATN